MSSQHFVPKYIKKATLTALVRPFAGFWKSKIPILKMPRKTVLKGGEKRQLGTCEAYLTSFREESIHIDELFLMNYSYM